jgi:hypothetical protein
MIGHDGSLQDASSGISGATGSRSALTRLGQRNGVKTLPSRGRGERGQVGGVIRRMTAALESFEKAADEAK